MATARKARDDAAALICRQATKISSALTDDPVDDWVDVLDKMLRLYVDQTRLEVIASAIADAHGVCGDPQAAEIILERAIVQGRLSPSWDLAE